MVETNFADLPVINEVSNMGRVKKIEALIHAHNQEVNQFTKTRFLRNNNAIFSNSPKPVSRNENNLPRTEIFDNSKPLRNSNRNPIGTMQLNFGRNPSTDEKFKRGTTVGPVSQAFNSEVRQFPHFDFMSNFNTPFESNFFGTSKMPGGQKLKHETNNIKETKIQGNSNHEILEPVVEIENYQQEIKHQSPRDPYLHINKQRKRLHKLQHVNRRFRNRPHRNPSLGPINMSDIPIRQVVRNRASIADGSVVAHVPGPAPIASVLPSYNTIKAPVSVVRENLRLTRNTRQENIPLFRRKRELTNEFETVINKYRNPFGKQTHRGNIFV